MVFALRAWPIRGRVGVVSMLNSRVIGVATKLGFDLPFY
jgi:hypothetical protein